jgi:hypothetical protein
MFVGGYAASFAIDMESDHLYWADYMIGILFRSDLDGSNSTEILTYKADLIVISLKINLFSP